jgi:hypothetical protein
MKKIIGMIVVMAMVLSMLPLAAFAVPGTYDVSVGFSEYIDLYAEDQLTLLVDATEKDVLLTVDGMGCFDWHLDNGMQQFYPEMNGAYSLKLKGGNVYELLLVSDNGFEDQTLHVALTAPKLGSEENPAELVMGENAASVDGTSAYFFSFTATESGKLDIAIDTAKCSDWSFAINRKSSNGSIQYGDMHYSDDETVISADSVVVQPDDVVTVIVSTATMFIPGDIYFNAAFTAGDFGGEGGSGSGGDIGQIGGGDITVEDEAVTIANPWTYTFTTEGPGALRVVMGECTPGWRYKIYFPNGEESLYFTASEYSVGPDYTHELTAPGQYYVKIWAYDEALFDDVNGTISATLTYTPYGDDVEIPKEEYIVSEILLGLGENSLILDETAITTIYEFTPDEIGIYKFTLGDSAALIGYWGAGSFFVQDLTENKTNVMEHELNAVGQSIMVGVSNVEGEFTMTIEKIGSLEEIEQIEYKDYVNKHTPSDANLINTLGVNINPIDITKVQSVVKGSDGFYHLGSANGPVIYANLSNDAFDILQAFFSGYGALVMRGKYIDPNGNEYFYDFLNAMRSYATVLYNSDYDNVMYPLTEDLMIFLKAFGSYQGWYSPEQSPFEAILSEHNADSAWLVTCVTVSIPSEYRVTGSADWLGNWAADFEGGVMSDLGNGSYQIVFPGVAAGDYELKVTKNGSWDENWGVGGMNGGNVQFSAEEGQTVIVTFTSATGAIDVAVTGGESNPESGDLSVAALSIAMMAATAGVVVLTKKKEF